MDPTFSFCALLQKRKVFSVPVPYKLSNFSLRLILLVENKNWLSGSCANLLKVTNWGRYSKLVLSLKSKPSDFSPVFTAI